MAIIMCSGGWLPHGSPPQKVSGVGRVRAEGPRFGSGWETTISSRTCEDRVKGAIEYQSGALAERNRLLCRFGNSVDSGRVNTASEMSPCRERLSFPRLRAGGARLPFLRTRRRLTLQILSQLSAGAKFNCLRRIRVRLYVIANLSSYQLVASRG